MSQTKVLHRDARRQLPHVARGEGCYLIDRDGRRYLDACGGAAVSCLGHSYAVVTDAIKRQLDLVSYAHTSYFTSDVLEELAERLIAILPGAFARASFYCGGSEAMEAAIKNTRQYFLELGKPSRTHFIARRQSFHGNTLGTLSVGNHALRTAPYVPYLFPVSHVAPCYSYRDKREGESDVAYGLRLAHELEQTILALGPDTVAGFIAETVAGATLGAAPAVPGYFRSIREICDKYGIVLILDEVMAGSGRTGTWFAFEQEGMTPDIVVIAKGLGAGYQPISAVMLSPRIVDAIDAGSGVVAHSHTYMGHACGAAAALAVVQAIHDNQILENVRCRGTELRTGLDSCFASHPHIGDIRGRGLLLALEIVEDRSSKAPFEQSSQVAGAIKSEAFELGLMVYPSPGTIDGAHGAHVLLAPPYIVGAQQISEILDKLPRAIDLAIAKIARI
jgi:adenosylmethionine-8-amino-7-oxononanoate aminotransferase